MPFKIDEKSNAGLSLPVPSRRGRLLTGNGFHSPVVFRIATLRVAEKCCPNLWAVEKQDISRKIRSRHLPEATAIS
jgi:hypothetical protein